MKIRRLAVLVGLAASGRVGPAVSGPDAGHVARRKAGDPHPFVTPGVVAPWIPELRAEGAR